LYVKNGLAYHNLKTGSIFKCWFENRSGLKNGYKHLIKDKHKFSSIKNDLDKSGNQMSGSSCFESFSNQSCPVFKWSLDQIKLFLRAETINQNTQAKIGTIKSKCENTNLMCFDHQKRKG
jgi:hypothetical protein